MLKSLGAANAICWLISIYHDHHRRHHHYLCISFTLPFHFILYSSSRLHLITIQPSPLSVSHQCIHDIISLNTAITLLASFYFVSSPLSTFMILLQDKKKKKKNTGILHHFCQLLFLFQQNSLFLQFALISYTLCIATPHKHYSSYYFLHLLLCSSTCEAFIKNISKSSKGEWSCFHCFLPLIKHNSC